MFAVSCASTDKSSALNLASMSTSNAIIPIHVIIFCFKSQKLAYFVLGSFNAILPQSPFEETTVFTNTGRAIWIDYDCSFPINIISNYVHILSYL